MTPELLATIRSKIASHCALQWAEAKALLEERDLLASIIDGATLDLMAAGDEDDRAVVVGE